MLWLSYLQRRKSATEVKMPFLGVNCAPGSSDEEAAKLGEVRPGGETEALPPVHLLRSAEF